MKTNIGILKEEIKRLQLANIKLLNEVDYWKRIAKANAERDLHGQRK